MNFLSAFPGGGEGQCRQDWRIPWANYFNVSLNNWLEGLPLAKAEPYRVILLR